MSIFDYLNHKIVGWRIRNGVKNLLTLRDIQENRIADVSKQISVLYKQRQKAKSIVFEINKTIAVIKEDLES